MSTAAALCSDGETDCYVSFVQENVHSKLWTLIPTHTHIQVRALSYVGIARGVKCPRQKEVWRQFPTRQLRISTVSFTASPLDVGILYLMEKQDATKLQGTAEIHASE